MDGCLDEHRQRVHEAAARARSSTSSNSLFSRFDQPPGGQYVGWYQYFDRDINSLLGKHVPQPVPERYCGHGNMETCQSAIWNAIAAAGDELDRRAGHRRPGRLARRRDRGADPLRRRLPLTTMRYTNRPSGIQQVISFDGHRK